MANTISQYFKDSDGNLFSNDSSMISLSTNSYVTNINSGEKFKKIDVNVFDREGESISDATKTSKGIVQIGDGLSVSNGVISTDGSISYNSSQNLTNTQINKALSNLGISHYTGTGGRFYTRQITFGNTQILYGQSTLMISDGSDKYATALYGYPFISAPIVATSGFSTVADSSATCCVIGYNSSPRGDLLGSGSDDHISRGFFISIGQRFPLVESAKVGGTSDLTESTGTWYLDIPKSYIDLSGTYAYFLVDMFMTSNTSSSDYIEYSGSSDYVKYGYTKLSKNSRYENGRYTRDYDLDLSVNPDGVHSSAIFAGYADINGSKLFDSSDFNTFIMRSFILEVPVSNLINGGSYFRIGFSHSLSNNAKARIRAFYIPQA